MKTRILISGITLLLKQINKDDVEAVADKVIDVVEIKYKDNLMVQTSCGLIRQAFSIEDND